jgi:hypothetical protein
VSSYLSLRHQRVACGIDFSTSWSSSRLSYFSWPTLCSFRNFICMLMIINLSQAAEGYTFRVYSKIDLSKIFEWYPANFWKLIPAKSRVLPISTRATYPALFLGNDFIPYKYKAKNLGVTFCYHLNWGDHFSTICAKSVGTLLGSGHWQMPLLLPFVCRFSQTAIVFILPLALLHWGNLVLVYSLLCSCRAVLTVELGIFFEEECLIIFPMSPTQCWIVVVEQAM